MKSDSKRLAAMLEQRARKLNKAKSGTKEDQAVCRAMVVIYSELAEMFRALERD